MVFGEWFSDNTFELISAFGVIASLCVNGETVALENTPLPYPITCAAHHLIPAQEALKDNPILQMVRKPRLLVRRMEL